MDSATRACAASPLLLLARGGPLALNSAPPNSTPEEGDPYALDALGHGYALGYAVWPQPSRRCWCS
ncbi:hypothetical protein [Streptomyces sp. NPDC058385]|uniref:hypothetical protein n=1 Tax=Streptomyces sp. NPDC058385 TaxID=3346473 RepID=UPI003666DB7F